MKKISQLPFVRIFSRWFDAANNAINGILQAAKTQRHLKFHLLAAFSVLLFCFALGVNKYDFAVIALVTLLVIVAEMFNSALEAAVDLSTRESSELARTAKDIAAGAVLISAVGSLVTAYLILGPHIVRYLAGTLPRPAPRGRKHSRSGRDHDHAGGHFDQSPFRQRLSPARRFSQRPHRVGFFVVDIASARDREPLAHRFRFFGSAAGGCQSGAPENPFLSRRFFRRPAGIGPHPGFVPCVLPLRRRGGRRRRTAPGKKKK